jgi:hypothetical protein
MKPRTIVFPALSLCLIANGLRAQQSSPAGVPGGYNGWQRNKPLQLGAGGRDVWIKMDTVSLSALVAGDPMEVFRKAQYVYGSLKLKTTLADSVGGIMGNTGFNHSGALAGQRMSYWLGCGTGMMGPNADRWRVTMSILTSVEPASKDSSRLRTVIIASARNMAEGSADPTNCNSTGKLEETIHKKVQSMPPAASGSE